MKKNKPDVMESYKRLRNIIENYSNNVKCISITSNSDIEGKTIIAKNIAMILAKSGKKTLYVDCNLYNSSKVKILDSSKENGLLGMLKGVNNIYISDSELKDYVSDTKCENLSILTLGNYNLDNYMSVFKTEVLKLAMERLKISFDYIIMDAPSFENLSYTQIAAAATDGSLFVLKGGIHEVGEGRLIKEKLDTIGCKVLGCILDKEKKSTSVLDDRLDSFLNMEGGTRKYRAKTKNKVSIET